MASKDFIYDLLEKLEEGRQEYILMTMEKNEEGAAGDLFYNFYYEDSKQNAARILREMADALEKNPDQIDDIEIDLTDEDDE